MEEFTVEKIVELLLSSELDERLLGTLYINRCDLGQVVTCLEHLKIDCEKRIELVFDYFPWLEIPRECECGIGWERIVFESEKSKNVTDVLEVGNMDAA